MEQVHTVSKIVLIFSILSFPAQQVLAESSSEPVKMAVISLASPSKIYQQWQAFSDYLSAKIGREVEIVVPRGFKKIKQAVEKKEVDIFYVNSHVFYKLKKKGKAVAIAQMQNLSGSTVSNSVMFVRNDSDIKSLKDLKGEKVAFVSPMGAGGYLAPRATFYKQGIKTKTETEEQFTKNLTSSIHKVLLGNVKAGTMCGLNFKLMSDRMDAGDLRIIATSDDYPENAFGARPELSKEFREKISSVIIGMYDDAKGRKVLDAMNGMKIKKFVAYDENSEELTEYLLESGEFNKK